MYNSNTCLPEPQGRRGKWQELPGKAPGLRHQRMASNATGGVREREGERVEEEGSHHLEPREVRVGMLGPR